VAGSKRRKRGICGPVFRDNAGIRRTGPKRNRFRARAFRRSNGLKIVDVSEFYSERGGGVRSHLTVRGHFLCQLGHDHVVIAPGPRDEDALLGANVAPRSGRTRIVRLAGPALPYDRTYHLLGRFDKIRRFIRTERPDVIEAHSPYLAAAAVLCCGLRRDAVRTAFWHADHLGTYLQPAIASLLGPRAAEATVSPLWRGVRSLLSPFDATFVAGRAQANRLRAAGVTRIVQAPFGVDVETFHPGARSDAIRREWLNGAGERAVLLVGVGRFAVEKRWDVVLEAFARVRARREAILVLFGDGPERSRLERMAPPGVRFAGFVNDRARMAAVLASADALVHGCPYETFGLGVAEAVACGLPVVVPDAGGASETVDPECGRSYSSLDAAACAAAIDHLFAGDRLTLRANALQASARVPTLSQHFARVLDTYEELRLEKEARRESRQRR